jgi:hypothetical protein
MSLNHIANSTSKVEDSLIKKQDKTIPVSEIKWHPTEPFNGEANETKSIASRWNLIPVFSGRKILENGE